MPGFFSWIPRIELGVVARRVDVPGSEEFLPRGDFDNTDRATAMGMLLRIASNGRVFFGAEMEVDAVLHPPRHDNEDDVTQLGGVIGLQQRVGPFGVAAELTGGLRAILTDRYEYGDRRFDAHRSRYLEAHLRLDAHLTKHVGLSVFAGTTSAAMTLVIAK